MVINSLIEFIEKVALHRGMTIYSNAINSASIFRGQSNAEWQLQPSVFRNEEGIHEAALMREFERQNPIEFSGLTNIQKIIKMQHYGLPTRLLDFSLNPLVALYFACSDSSTDGAVFALHGYPLHNEEKSWISIVAKALYEYELKNICIQDVLQEILTEPSKYPSISVESSCTEKDICRLLEFNAIGFLPKLTNPRIAAQEGVFLIMGNKLHNTKSVANRTYFSYKNVPPLDVKEIWKNGMKYIIPKEAKEQIRDDLRKIGVHGGKLFPELASQSQHIERLIYSTNWTHMGKIE